MLGIRKAIFSLKVVIQRWRDINKAVHLCFIDFSRAFDNVKHEKLIEVYKKLALMEMIYWSRTATIKVGNALAESSDGIKINGQAINDIRRATKYYAKHICSK